MASSLASVIQQFAAADMPAISAHELQIDTNHWHRYGPKKRAYYKVLSLRTRSGKTVYVGTFGQGSAQYRIEPDGDQHLSDDDMQDLQRKREAIDRADQARREQDAAAAANRAHMQWALAAPSGYSPYAERKRIAPESHRVSPDGVLLVPLWRYDQQPAALAGLQSITPWENEHGGNKRFTRAMRKQGAACRLGDAPAPGMPIILVEGYATGCSIRMALERALPVYVGFDAGNLIHVARVLRAAFPASPIVIAADDDYLPTRDGSNNREGEHQARQVVGSVARCSLVLPSFSVARRQQRDDETLPKLTDFNDLHVAEGLNIVAAQLRAALAQATEAEATTGGALTLPQVLARFALIFGTTHVWDDVEQCLLKKAAFTALVGTAISKAWYGDPAKRQKRMSDLPKATRPGNTATADASRTLLDRYTLLYGTETVWDAQARIILSLSALRAAFGSDAVRYWQENPLRRMVDADKLTFDPTERVDPATHVNLFGGMPLKPVHDEQLADPIVGLVMHLCNHDPSVYHWLMQWIALPLQQPGTKMDTSVLMFGEKQGTGKSLFWEGVIKAIYGEYGTTIGQYQLDSQFTGWQSRRLFVLAEEVVGRAEKYSHIGTIKHLVTGRTMRINEKNMPEREETNHANIVFLSNEVQPLHLELDDRRFLAIEPRTLLNERDQQTIRDAFAAGGIAAFYGYLLRYPIDPGFDRRSKPIVTAAKTRLIEYGLPPWQVFYRAWKAGQLDVPYQSCCSQDLFRAYRHWAADHGGGEKLTETKFCSLIAARETKRVEWLRDTGGRRRQRTVFVIDDAPADTTKEAWFSARCQRFVDAMQH
ncbi:DUF5906 domain-containing protein [Jeongeupia naejangsanensis]|uniref:NrS-1 polymerase-like helicase domain-containing protein n=1 Tax=Jeongeupia naejangsanensis TaxID=613195 RepID=A0ABS2BH91_9NEIS|nr:DUF5906 domain-containing protein [Jeongeupia naejangsanensis]MBM3114988.1 hypothetical protein [Jeongeupia naejangsanensis]